MLCIFDTFTSKYFHFVHVILTMLSSTYHFWGVHNLYQAKSAKLNIGKQSKVGLFFLFRFSLFVFHFFDIQNRAQYRILTFKLRSNILFLHSKSYFDIQTGAEYRILIFKILFWNSKSGRKSYFDIQNPILTFKPGPNIVFWHSKSYFDI